MMLCIYVEGSMCYQIVISMIIKQGKLLIIDCQTIVATMKGRRDIAKAAQRTHDCYGLPTNNWRTCTKHHQHQVFGITIINL